MSLTLSLVSAYKWAFVLVGFCPSGLLSQWAFVQWAFVLVGFCPSGLLSYTLCILTGYRSKMYISFSFSNFFKNFYQEYQQSVKQFGSRSGQMFSLDLVRLQTHCLQNLSSERRHYLAIASRQLSYV